MILWSALQYVRVPATLPTTMECAFLTRSSRSRRWTVVAWEKLPAKSIEQAANNDKSDFLVIKFELDATASKPLTRSESRQEFGLHGSGNIAQGRRSVGALYERPRAVIDRPSNPSPCGNIASAMAVNPELLKILVCPLCKDPVNLTENGQGLKCAQCRRIYPIRDDIPVMLIGEAKIED